MMTASLKSPVRTLLDLATPWVYRRESGRYSLRVRLKGTKRTYTLSLKTTGRSTAMTIAKHLVSTLKAFHLDNPEASWDDLKARLIDIAEGALWSPSEDPMGLVWSDLSEDLQEIAKTMPLTLAQAKALTAAQEVLRGSQGRIHGDLKGLVGTLEMLKGPERAPTVQASVPALICKAPLSFKDLSESYLKERGGDLSASSLKGFNSNTTTIAEALSGLDLRAHTRADLVGLRESLLVGRMPSTVNKLLVHLSSVLTWAVSVGELAASYDKKLTILKGSDSSRVAFSEDQLQALKVSAKGTQWEQVALALGIATGARIGELHQLTGKDFYKVNGVWAMSINDDGDKTLKNSYSRRMVPVVGIPEETLQVLSETTGPIFKPAYTRFCYILNNLIRATLGTTTKGSLSFHSLRHSLASDLKASGCPLGTAQEILGHSSGSISYDLYGGGAGVDLERLVKALLVVRKAD